jgi:hypothetical protein
VEKILPRSVEKRVLFNGRSFLPVFENNQLVMQGYFHEIDMFVNLCEGRSKRNIASLESMMSTCQLLEDIQTESMFSI